jgi:hypothetical protein
MRILLSVILLLAFTSVAFSDFPSGAATCPSSGRAQVSTTPYNLYQITVQALTSNSGVVYVGSSSVTTSSGGGLIAGASYNANKPSAAINPADLYFACTVNTDGVTWIGSR